MKRLWHILRTFLPKRNNPYVGLLYMALPLFGADLKIITPTFSVETVLPVWNPAKYQSKAEVVDLPVLAEAPNPKTFSLLNFWPGYAWAPLPSNTFSFPYRGGSFPAFVVQTNATPQDISAGAITATFRVVASEDVAFTFGGEGRWNIGNMPPHVRLFFSSYHGYLNESGCPECFWFSQDGWVKITNGVFTITATFDPARWTHGGGQTWPSAFQSALTNVIEAGVAFGGGQYFDTGVGITNGVATFEMLSLDFLPGTGALSLNLTNGLNRVESSIDLPNWMPCTMRVGPGVVRFPVGPEAARFWRATPL